MKSTTLKKKIIDELKKTPVVEVACAKAGIGRTTFYEWKKKDLKFSEAVDIAMYDGRDFISDVAEGQLLNAIKSGDFRSIALWLKTHRAEYRSRVEIDGKLETIQELSDEQKELVRKALTLANITLENHESGI